MTDRDEVKDLIKQAFARDPMPLVNALGLRVDDRKSKGGNGRSIWVFDGAEEEASLQIGGKPGMKGLCTRYGDDWHRDCFGLVQRVRPSMGFRQRLEFVAQVYGIALPERVPRTQGVEKREVVAKHDYSVRVDGQVVAVHKRLDFAGGGKRMWWAGPDGKAGVPDGVVLTELPLWGAEALPEYPGRSVIVCEGEKDAGALREQGVLAIGTYGADVIPGEAPLEALAGRSIYLWPDNDHHGRKHMRRVAERVAALGQECFVIEWAESPSGGGATDWFEAGRTADELRAMAPGARSWREALPDPEEQEAAEALVNELDRYEPPSGITRGARPVEELAPEIIEAVETRRQLPAGIYGLRSGWPTVDAHFGGFKFEGLILLLGGSGIGKTTLARHFLFATLEHLVQVQSDARVLFYALEGGLEQFFWYYAGYDHGIPLRSFAPGGMDHMTDEIDLRMADAYVNFPLLPITISEERDGSRIMFDIERQVEDGEVEAVILDNVQKIQFASGNQWEQNKRLAARVADFCKTTKIPFLALSQVNEHKGRAQEPRGGPEWFHEAGCVLTAQRGEGGASQEEALQTNLTRLTNQKLRYATGGIMREQRLVMNLETKRLYEEAVEAVEEAQASRAAPRDFSESASRAGSQRRDHDN